MLHCACSAVCVPRAMSWLSHSWHSTVTSLALSARGAGNLARLKECGEKKDKYTALKGAWGCHCAKPTRAEWEFSQDPGTDPCCGMKICCGAVGRKLSSKLRLQEGEEEEEKPSMGQAAQTTPRAAGIFHSSPCPGTLVWVFSWCCRDGSFPAVRTLGG